MGKMVNGEWTTKWYGHQEDGEFVREDTVFHDWVKDEEGAKFRPQAGRYHLYVSYACPWACRVLAVRSLLGLQEAIDASVVHPFMGDDGWSFDSDYEGASGDQLQGKDFLREIYKAAASDYTGRVTVPVLWDTEQETIVNNESRDLIEMLDQEFTAHSDRGITLFPEAQRESIDEVIDAIYSPINNGVYRCGFAASQEAYDRAVTELFKALDHWEEVLGEQRYLCGDTFTAADICMFTTLVRFDPVYNTHFKCNLRQISEYENLWNYTREIYQMPGIAETVNFDHIKRHYFTSHESVNPKRIIAAGPILDFEAPHDRKRLQGRFAERG